MAQKTLAVVFGGFLMAGVAAETFTSSDVIARSVNRECLDWKVIGACFWLKCSARSCQIRTSPKIQHNLPDLVVSAYPHENPWLEMRATEAVTLPAVAGNFLAGGGDPGRERRESSTVRFKEACVAGNPAVKFRNIFGVHFLCKSKAQPLKVYFSSRQNLLAWRGQGADQLRREAWIPGEREIGSWPDNTWGSVYPRTGFLAQSEDPKAAAVIAQRAVDIVTREGTGFDYVPLGHAGHRWETWGDPHARTPEACSETGGLWIPPNPIEGRAGRCVTRRSVQWLPGSNEQTDKWQMISPVVAHQCETFGASGAWSDGKESDDGNYAWNYWKQYKCCVPRSGRYLHSIEF